MTITIPLPPAPIFKDFDTGNPSVDSWRFDAALAAWRDVCMKIIEKHAVPVTDGKG